MSVSLYRDLGCVIESTDEVIHYFILITSVSYLIYQLFLYLTNKKKITQEELNKLNYRLDIQEEFNNELTDKLDIQEEFNNELIGKLDIQNEFNNELIDKLDIQNKFNNELIDKMTKMVIINKELSNNQTKINKSSINNELIDKLDNLGYRIDLNLRLINKLRQHQQEELNNKELNNIDDKLDNLGHRIDLNNDLINKQEESINKELSDKNINLHSSLKFTINYGDIINNDKLMDYCIDNKLDFNYHNELNNSIGLKLIQEGLIDRDIDNSWLFKLVYNGFSMMNNICNLDKKLGIYKYSRETMYACSPLGCSHINTLCPHFNGKFTLLFDIYLQIYTNRFEQKYDIYKKMIPILMSNYEKSSDTPQMDEFKHGIIGKRDLYIKHVGHGYRLKIIDMILDKLNEYD
jgi:hypothetical protein